MKSRNNLIKLIKTGLENNIFTRLRKDKKTNGNKKVAIDGKRIIIKSAETDFEEENFEIRDKYKDFDMSVFNREDGLYNYKNMRSSNIGNRILIESSKDRNYTVELISTLLLMTREKIEEYNLNKILSDTVVFEDENEIGRTSLSFTPFTKTGKIKKFPHELSFQTKEVIMTKYYDFEHMVSDGAPFGRMSLDCDLKIGKASVHIWNNKTRNSYSFKIIDDELIINKIVKSTLQDFNDGKPEKIIFEM